MRRVILPLKEVKKMYPEVDDHAEDIDFNIEEDATASYLSSMYRDVYDECEMINKKLSRGYQN